MELDSKDLKILQALKEDSRKSIKEISKITKIRPSTVHHRIQKHKENKVIEKLTVKHNNTLAGENFVVYMLVKGSTAEYIDSRFLNDTHVKEIFGITGEYDLLIKLKFRNVEDFNDFVINFRKNRKEIQSTLSMVVTADLKEEI